jgi:hypothetical protein
MEIPTVVWEIILKYKEDMELLLKMENKFKMSCSEMTLCTLQSDLIKKYLHIVTNHNNQFRDVRPFNILDEYFDIQYALQKRLQIWNIPEKSLLNDTLWSGLVAKFIMYFLECSILH